MEVLHTKEPIDICTTFSARTWSMLTVTLVVLLVLSLCNNGAEARSVGKESETSRRIYTRSRRGLRACGSKLVDALNYYCDAKIYEPMKCYLASRYWCRRRPNLLICRIDCGMRRKKRSSEHTLTTTGVARAVLERLAGFETSTQSGTRSIRQAQRKTKRHLYSQCCGAECTVDDLGAYCKSA